jgi:microcystin-dependent protein
MCDCGKKSCNTCNNGSSAALASQVQSLTELLNGIANLTKWLKGHPIIAIDNADDIASFDATSGVGSGNWLGWGICNGTNYASPAGPVNAPDLRDRFLTGIGGTYVVGDIGGENFHQLSIPELPIHNHALTDPGHTHVVNDPGHAHGITDPGHTHVAVASPHQHSFTSDPGGAHSHTYDDHERTTIWVGCITAGPLGTVMYKNTSSTVPGDVELANDNDSSTSRTTSASSNFTIGGTTDQTTETIAVSTEVTDITVQINATGITNQTAVTGISLADTGSDQTHENRPPYYACLFVKKIY